MPGVWTNGKGLLKKSRSGRHYIEDLEGRSPKLLPEREQKTIPRRHYVVQPRRCLPDLGAKQGSAAKPVTHACLCHVMANFMSMARRLAVLVHGGGAVAAERAGAHLVGVFLPRSRRHERRVSMKFLCRRGGCRGNPGRRGGGKRHIVRRADVTWKPCRILLLPQPQGQWSPAVSLRVQSCCMCRPWVVE